MLEKDLRKTYYQYFDSFELIKKKLIKYLYSEELFFYKQDKESIKIEFEQYIENISKLTTRLNEEKLEKQQYQKMLNQMLFEIEIKQKLLEKSFNNLLENEIEKFYLCKKDVKLILKIHKKIVIAINMYSSYKSYFYNYPTTDLKKLNSSQLEKGDIILSLKSDKIIKENLFYKLISKFTKSNIGHSTIFIGVEKNKNKYIDIQDGQATIKNFLLNKDSVKFVKTSNKYSNNVVGLVLRIKNGLSKKEEDQIFKYIESKVNLEYGVLKVLIGLAFGKIYENLPINKLPFKNPDQNLRSMFCSEFVIRTYENADIYLRNKSDPATTTPADILNSPQLQVIGYINK